MKAKLIVLAIISIIGFNACSNGHAQAGRQNLSANDFAKKMKENPTAVILDVRTPDEYSKGHLPNALNVDWNGSGFEAGISGLDKSKPVFVYCLSGGRSSSAAEKMRSEGFGNVIELDGGIMKWRAAGLPETTAISVASNGMNREQFESLLNTDKTVLIDFYADWCGPCKKMKPYLDEIAADRKGQVTVIRINADDNPQICNILQIDALPYLQVYKNKSITWSNKGYVEKEEVLKHL